MKRTHEQVVLIRLRDYPVKKFALMINLKMAEQIGLMIRPNVLVRTDGVS
jgi:hypothetical protein